MRKRRQLCSKDLLQVKEFKVLCRRRKDSRRKKGVKSRNEYLQWLQKKNEEENKIDLVTSLSLRFSLLKLLSGKKSADVFV